MSPINVVCGIIQKEGKIFIARRKPHKSLGGYWEFPGGKVEPGEDPVTALTRELKEELDMTIANAILFGENLHSYNSSHIHINNIFTE